VAFDRPERVATPRQRQKVPGVRDGRFGISVLKLTVVKAHVASRCHEGEMLCATIITRVRPMARSPITGAGVRLRINGSEHLLQIEPPVTLLDVLRSLAIGLTLRQTESRRYGDILQTSLGNP
jgi:hypothetical protein